MISIINVCLLVKKEVSPEARYLLYRLAMAGPEPGIERSCLRQLMGVSALVAERSLKELLGHGYAVERKGDGLAGRDKQASRRVVPAPDLMERLAMDDELPPWIELSASVLGEAPSVTYPLSEKNKPLVKGRAGRLSVRNRLLLGLLLESADRGGIIRRTRPKKIARFAGMTAIQLRYQLGKLVDLSYLRAVVPGVTGQALFGVSPGAYFLNLAHPDYGELAPNCQCLVYPAESFALIGSDAVREGAGLYTQLSPSSTRQPSPHAVGWLRVAGIGDDEVAVRAMAEIFDGVGSPNLPDFLQMKIEAYASQLLTDFRSHLADEDLFQRSGLWAQIRRDLFPGGASSSRDSGSASSTDLMTLVVQLVATLSLDLACNVNQVVTASFQDEHRASRGCPLVSQADDEWAWVIMPAIKEASRLYCAILLVRRGKAESSLPGGSVLPMRAVADGKWCAEKPLPESAIGDEMLYRFGLLTRPVVSRPLI